MTRRYVRRKPPVSLHAERLLAALTCAEGRLVPDRDLIAAIYHGYDAVPASAETVLRQTVGQLRKAGHCIVNLRLEGYALGGSRTPRLPTRHQAVLDRLTQACGQFVSVDELAAVIWPDEQDRPASVAGTVSMIVRRLRDIGCDIASHKRVGYRLDAIIEGESRPALRIGLDGTTEPWRL